jgi:hypothetical protein
MKTILLALVMTFFVCTAHSEPAKVTLADYSFNFAKHGYEISVSGTTHNYSDSLTADDYIHIKDDGYRIKTLIDRLSRSNRMGFINFYNQHCVGFSSKCAITASGDVELDENMKMIFRISNVSIAKGSQNWASQ